MTAFADSIALNFATLILFLISASFIGAYLSLFLKDYSIGNSLFSFDFSSFGMGYVIGRNNFFVNNKFCFHNVLFL